MKRMIKIGTRDSKLAVYQATKVQELLSQQGVKSELVFIKTIGDRDQVTPLSAFKNPGIFANEVNQQVQSGAVDLGVHSCKDMPSRLDDDIEIGAVLERANTQDTLVYKPSFHDKIDNNDRIIIATSSERRRMQWLDKYPNTEIMELRGNIPTRLQKLQDNKWDGAIFAQAALDRLGIEPEFSMRIDSFVPAACQGTIAIVNRVNDDKLKTVLNTINHQPTFVQTQLEREILRNLQIGCSTPFGCQASFEKDGIINIKAQLFTKDGSSNITAEVRSIATESDNLVSELIAVLNAKGAEGILAEMKE